MHVVCTLSHSNFESGESVILKIAMVTRIMYLGAVFTTKIFKVLRKRYLAGFLGARNLRLLIEILQ